MKDHITRPDGIQTSIFDIHGTSDFRHEGLNPEPNLTCVRDGGRLRRYIDDSQEQDNTFVPTHGGSWITVRSIMTHNTWQHNAVHVRAAKHQLMNIGP